MANEIRVRGNFVSGTLSSSMSNVVGTMSSAALASLPAIGSTQHAVISIENEIMYVTAHTGGATTATVLRGQEGTSGAAHSTVPTWYHGPVASDFTQVLGYAQVTANQTGITTTVDLTSLTVTATVPYPGHRIRVSAQINMFSSVTGDRVDLFIAQDGTGIQDITHIQGVGGTNQSMSGFITTVPTAASHIWKLQLGRASGSGTITMAAGAGFPACILVEDLGPAA